MVIKKKTGSLISFLLLFAMLLSFVPVYGAEQTDPERFGTVEYVSTFTAGTTITDSFYYSDDWFLEDPEVRNDALGLVSMQLVAAAVENDENGMGTAYLKDLGFEETGLGGFEEADPEGCCFTWGIKTIETGEETFTLVAIVIQSHSSDQTAKQIGWRQNFLVNGQSPTAEHASYAAAAESVLPWVSGLELSGNVKYWVMGQSRGGAIAGTLAVRLKEYAESIYAYTFESPANVDLSYVPENEQTYAYIHNYLCSDDIVTMIPPWGMGRYGVEHRLNTEEITQQLSAMLHKMGSDAAELAEYYDSESTESFSANLIQALVERIPAREDYSAIQTDVFTDADGKEIRISYLWQDVFVGLMKIVFGNVFEGIDTDRLLEQLPDILPAVSSLYKAVTEENESAYYEAARSLSAFLEKAGLELPLQMDTLYALLKLAGPIIINTEYVPESDEISQDELFLYILPAITIYENSSKLVFSHQFDTIIARLKVLAEEPAMEDIDVALTMPSPGDDVASSADSAGSAFHALGYSWMDVSADWITVDTQFMDDKVYFLEVALSSVGHSIPEDLAITINGREPVAPLDITYTQGVTHITGVWEYVLGNPQDVQISFDMEGHGEELAPTSVPTGSILKYTLSPDAPEIFTDSEGSFSFEGWYDENGVFWEEVCAEQDLTLHADWNRMIDQIEISFVVPCAGEEVAMPEVPQEAPYYIASSYLYDEEWCEASVASDKGEMNLHLDVKPVSEETRFLTGINEYDEEEYIGLLTLNGEELQAWYDPEFNELSVNYTFIPLPAGSK